MLTLRRSIVALLTAALFTSLALVTAPAAAAGSGTRIDPGSWQRYVAGDFTSPADDLCPFELQSHVLFDLVYVRTFATFPDGSPRVQAYVGPLVVRFTNTATGTSIDRDLSGSALATYRPDGSYDFSIVGPATVGFRAYRGDSLPTGYYVLQGYHVVRFAADGTRTLAVDQGAEENVCTTLA